MNEREKKKAHALRYWQKVKRSTLEKYERDAERTKQRERTKRGESPQERCKRILAELLERQEIEREQREAEEHKAAGGLFYTFPKSDYIYDNEREAREAGGEAVRGFKDLQAAFDYAETGKDAERREEEGLAPS
jgi:hypothetical protein